MAQKQYKKRTYKRKAKVSKMVTAAPKTQKSLIRLIKKVNLKESELKFKSRNLDYAAMNHDAIVKIPIWDKDALVSPVSVLPTQGLTDANRVGDRIHALKIKVRLHFDIPWDRKNCKLKVYFLEYNSDQGDPTNYGTLFHNITGNSRLDPVQLKRWGKSLRYLGDFKPQDMEASYTYINSQTPAASALATNTASIYVNRDIYLNRKIFFTNDGAMTPSNIKENGCLLIMPYATINTSTNDNIVIGMEGAATMYYKDL
ncbi:hypothetical protein [Rheinheimera sp.]|uniref:hypothetical protein n=1 Tax=Rheinheimera sp. TaxID=1869214 RepID=UPI0040481D77